MKKIRINKKILFTTSPIQKPVNLAYLLHLNRLEKETLDIFLISASVLKPAGLN